MARKKIPKRNTKKAESIRLRVDAFNEDMLELQVRALERLADALQFSGLVDDETSLGLAEIYRLLGECLAGLHTHDGTFVLDDVVDIELFPNIVKGKTCLVGFAMCVKDMDHLRPVEAVFGVGTPTLMDGVVHAMDYVMDAVAEVYSNKAVFGKKS